MNPQIIAIVNTLRIYNLDVRLTSAQRKSGILNHPNARPIWKTGQGTARHKAISAVKQDAAKYRRVMRAEMLIR